MTEPKCILVSDIAFLIMVLCLGKKVNLWREGWGCPLGMGDPRAVPKGSRQFTPMKKQGRVGPRKLLIYLTLHF